MANSRIWNGEWRIANSEKAWACPKARLAFSLLEMMIAIIILGFGLIMVATMFPVAWDRARGLNEYTTQVSCAEAADATVRMLAQVDGWRDSAGNYIDASSFAGDLVVDIDKIGNSRIISFSDTRVHALHMENILVNPRSFYPDRRDAANPAKNPSPPWRLEQAAVTDAVNDPSDPPVFFFDKAFGGPQIRFEARMHPALNPRAYKDLTNAIVTTPEGKFTGADPRWDELMDNRRYTFAVFHKMRKRMEEPLPDPPFLCPDPNLPIGVISAECIAEAVKVVQRPREFDVYYVTLRRLQSTYRFAQQDANSKTTPDPRARDQPVGPQALAPDLDVLFPVPWRVQVYFPAVNPAPTGVPTEARINDPAYLTSRFVIDFFPEGSQFIDEVSGRIYRVTNRRIVPGGTPNADRAFLTLDREVLLGDVDDNLRNGVFDPEEQLRAVWVFPPPVQAERIGGEPVFDGLQPVVGIDLRSLTVSPRS